MNDVDDHELDQWVRDARPVAPPDFEARVLGAARAGRGRARGATASAVLVLAAVIVMLVLRRPSPEGEPTHAIAPPAVPRLGSGSAAPAPSWEDPLGLMHALVVPRLARLQACGLGPVLRLRAYLALDVPESAPRPTRLSVIGHRTLTAEEACVQQVLDALAVPALPAQVLAIDLNLDLALVASGALFDVARLRPDDPWRDPVRVGARVIEDGAAACYGVTPLKGYPMPVPPRSDTLHLGISVTREPSGASHAHHVLDNEPRKQARCLEQALSRAQLPPLPAGVTAVELRYGMGH